MGRRRGGGHRGRIITHLDTVNFVPRSSNRSGEATSCPGHDINKNCVLKPNDKSFTLIVCAVHLAFTVLMATLWYNASYFDKPDLLFDTDPDRNILSYAHGWIDDENVTISSIHNLTHVLVELFSIPIYILAKVLWPLGAEKMGIINETILREYLALWISPLFSTLTIYVFSLILSVFKIERLMRNLILLIFASGFSNLIFGIIPETYSISSFLIAVACYYYLRCHSAPRFDHDWAWYALAVLITGVTITNICIFSIIYFVHLVRNRGVRFLKAVWQTGAVGAVTGFSLLLCWVVSHFLTGVDRGRQGRDGYIANFTVSDFSEWADNLLGVVATWQNAIVGFGPRIAEHYESVGVSVSFTNYPESGFIMTIVISVMLLMAINVIRCIRKEQSSQKDSPNLVPIEIYVISLLIVLFNLGFHSCFGIEPFLYSQHWIVSLMILYVPFLRQHKNLTMVILLCSLGVNLRFILTVDQLLLG